MECGIAGSKCRGITIFAAMSNAPVRVLVADNTPLIAAGVAAWLDGETDLEVVGHVPSGKALLEWFEQDEADLVLMEVSMKEMDGIDTMRALHRVRPAVHVLAHSELTDIEFVNSMRKEGARGYLVKGGDKAEMLEAIRTVLAGGVYLSTAARESVDRGYAYTEKQLDGEYIGLTPREREIIRLLALDHTNEEISAILFLSPETVKTHRKRIMAKLNVRSLSGLVRYARDRRWV
jgi:DNA-binding NarL/FixJ family response regulator